MRKNDETMPEKEMPRLTSERKRQLYALLDMYRFKYVISQFLTEIADAPTTLIEHCRLNGWNDEVAFTLRDAGFKLGVVLATLDRWARDAEIPQDVIDQVEEANKRMED